jgi:hypothetical protein
MSCFFTRDSIDKYFDERQNKWEVAESKILRADTLILILEGKHAIYKSADGFLKSIDITEE